MALPMLHTRERRCVCSFSAVGAASMRTPSSCPLDLWMQHPRLFGLSCSRQVSRPAGS